MTFSEQLQTALSLAIFNHEGQVDKRGVPFILHVLRVGLSGQTEDEIIAGLLHDIVEDTEVSLTDLDKLGFSWDVIEAVGYLTHYKEHTYNEYVDLLLKNPLATKVKYYDLQDNLDPSRQDFEGSVSLQRRHSKALGRVTGALILNDLGYPKVNEYGQRVNDPELHELYDVWKPSRG